MLKNLKGYVWNKIGKYNDFNFLDSSKDVHVIINIANININCWP